MSKDEILRLARKRYQEAVDAESPMRLEEEEDFRFISGDQWAEEDKQARKLARRPALTVNKLPGFVAQVVNDARQNKPATRVSPVDDKGDKDTADVINGLIRHIEHDSDANIARETAFESAVISGFGAYRILTEYCDDDDDSDDDTQQIKIKAIPDSFSVKVDPHSVEATREDAEYVFVVAPLMSRDEFKSRWPNSEAVGANFFDGMDDHAGDWISSDSVRVAEYWYIEKTPGKKRPKKTVHCAIINGCEVLEEYTFPGKYIPIVIVIGKELRFAGQHVRHGLVRFARDPQRLYNYYKTAQAEVIGLSPKAPFIGVTGQFENHESKWQTANMVNHAYLEYNPVSIAGEPAPPPQRNNFEPPVQALSIGALQASDDIKATTSIYDASLGNKSNETSGVAIQRRQVEGDTANFHFIDNLERAQKHEARIILGLIPHIYDTERTVRIIGEDETQKVVTLNAQYVDRETGKPRLYNVTTGKYDVVIKTGPSYTTKRQEAFAMLTEFGRAYPQLLELAGDLVFRNSDIPGGDVIADRLKKALPPELAADEKDENAQVPPQVQAQLKAMSQMVEQLSAALNEATSAIETKTLELESRERIANTQVQAKLASDLAKVGSTEAIEELRQTLSVIQQHLEGLRHEREMEAQAQQAQQEQQQATPEAA